MSEIRNRTQPLPLLVLLASAACGQLDAVPSDTAASEAARVEWTTAAPFPEQRTEVTATTDGQRMYVTGGFGPPTAPGARASAPRTLWAYHPATDAWESLGEIPEGVHHAGFVHLQGRLYLVGGFRETSFEPTGAVRVFDLGSRSWTEGAPMPTPRGAAATVLVGGRIHVIGGNAAGPDAVHDHDRPGMARDNSVGTHEVYDPRTDQWTRLPPMPTARNHHGAAAVGDRIHVVGGRADGNMELTVHEVFDTRAGGWERAESLPTGRSGIAVVERAGRIYVFGGESTRTFDDAERFDADTRQWLRLPPMPTARHGLGAAVLGDQIHVISGGPRPGFTYGSAHEKLGPVE